MATINGVKYPVGIHEIDGARVQVVDDFNAVAVGRVVQSVKLIDINTAELDELTELEGIGEAAAKRIIKARPFESVDDLVSIRGISARTVDANRKRITA